MRPVHVEQARKAASAVHRDIATFFTTRMMRSDTTINRQRPEESSSALLEFVREDPFGAAAVGIRQCWPTHHQKIALRHGADVSSGLPPDVPLPGPRADQICHCDVEGSHAHTQMPGGLGARLAFPCIDFGVWQRIVKSVGN